MIYLKISYRTHCYNAKPGSKLAEQAKEIITDHPKVVVGIPVFNGEKYLEARLKNLLAQDYPKLDIKISDNCSTDQTQKICEKYASEHHSIQYVRQKKNLGPVANFEYILNHADAEFFFFAATDDENPSNYVRECVVALTANPHCAACYSRIKFIEQDGSDLLQEAKDSVIRIAPDFSTEQKIRHFMIGPPNWLIYSFLNLRLLNRKLFRMQDYFVARHFEYPWVLGLLLSGSVCGTDKTHFTYRVKRGERQKGKTGAPPADPTEGIDRIHTFLGVLRHFSDSPTHEKRNRRALLQAVVQSHRGCKDWYQMTKHALTWDLLQSYLRTGQWDLVIFFLLMKAMRIKPLRVLIRQRIY